MNYESTEIIVTRKTSCPACYLHFDFRDIYNTKQITIKKDLKP